MSDLRLCTFDMRGFNSSKDFFTSLVQNLDIICLQEHWLRPNDVAPFSPFVNLHKFIYSGMFSVDKYTVKRLFGEYAILVNTSTVTIELDLGCSINNRVQSVLFEYHDKKFVVFNVYMPCVGVDDYDLNVERTCTFMLDIIENSVSLDYIIVVSDFNADLV